MADPRPLTRDELAKFLPNQRAIRAFERLFNIVPDELLKFQDELEENIIATGTAGAQSQHAIAQLAKDKELLLKLAEEASIDAGTALALAMLAVNRQSFSIDYIDFNPDPPHSDQDRRISWSGDDDTINIHHEDGVVQQVGLETYIRFTNQTGGTVNNGTVMGVDEPLAPPNFVVPYLSDGSTPSLNVLGVATQDIAAGEQGRLTTFGFVRGLDTTGTPYGETWSTGDTLYASPAVAGGFTNIKPTAPNWSIPMAIAFFVDATQGVIFVRPAIDQSFYYGLFSRNTNLSISTINTAEPIMMDTASPINGTSLGTPASRMVVDNSGLYSINGFFQLTSGSSSLKTVWLWLRLNGVDIPRTSIKTTVSGSGTIETLARSTFLSLNAGDYIEIYWASDSTNVTLTADPATAFAPSTPAATLSIEQIQQ